MNGRGREPVSWRCSRAYYINIEKYSNGTNVEALSRDLHGTSPSAARKALADVSSGLFLMLYLHSFQLYNKSWM